MKVTDAGTLKGDVLLFGGAYSNLQATQALFAETVHIPHENRICTGDLVAYCAEPLSTAQLVLAETGHVIAGNCEKQLAEGADDCGCGFEEGTACDLAARGWYPFAAARMASMLDQLAALPDYVTFTHNNLRYAVVHGGGTDIARFIWPSDDAAIFAEEVATIEAKTGPIDGIICGHSGIPFERHVTGKVWINAGVIGMPSHDGYPATRYAILGEDGVRFHSLDYDHVKASDAMGKAGLKQGYETALIKGIWPSEDILPNPLRR